jgi:hypothetical protein
MYRDMTVAIATVRDHDLQPMQLESFANTAGPRDGDPPRPPGGVWVGWCIAEGEAAGATVRTTADIAVAQASGLCL